MAVQNEKCVCGCTWYAHWDGERPVAGEPVKTGCFHHASCTQFQLALDPETQELLDAIFEEYAEVFAAWAK